MFLKGCGAGASLHKTLIAENSYRAGQSHGFTATLQCAAVETVVRSIEDLSLFTNTPFKQSWFAWTCQTVSLSGLAYCASRRNTPLWLRKITYLLYDNVGALAQLAHGVIACALLYLGKHRQGVGLLASSGVSLLLRRGAFPQAWRPPIEKAFQLLGAAYMLFYGAPMARMVTLIQGIILIDQYRNSGRTSVSPPPISGKTLEALHQGQGKSEARIQRLKEFMRRTRTDLDLQQLQREYCVETTHAFEIVVPRRSPSVTIRSLQDYAQNVDWRANAAIALAAVSADERFIERAAGICTPQEYIEEGIGIFLHRLENRSILEGEPESYEDLLAYTEWFVENFSSFDPKFQVDLLIKIGTLGRYCGPGLFEFLQNSYHELAGLGSLDIRKAVLMLTHDRRQECLSRFFYVLIQGVQRAEGLQGKFLRILFSLCNMGDIHHYNQVVHNFFPLLSVTHQSSQNDRNAHELTLRLLTRNTEALRSRLQREYFDVARMINYLVNRGRGLRLPASMITTWAAPLTEELGCDFADLVEAKQDSKGKWGSQLTYEGAFLLLVDCGIIVPRSPV